VTSVSGFEGIRLDAKDRILGAEANHQPAVLPLGWTLAAVALDFLLIETNGRQGA